MPCFARFALVLMVFLVSGCATPVMHTHEDTSRDYTWIRLEKGEKPFHAAGFVGGEHITSYRLLGFTGETYRITCEGERLYWMMDSGGAAELAEISDDVVEAEVLGLDGIINIELSAHPDSDYTLLIERLAP